MYYNDYEDYMRSILGYNTIGSKMYSGDEYITNRMQTVMPTYQNEYDNMQMHDNIEELYPNIYKIIDPIVCKVCQNNNKPITNDVIEQMTTEVYSNIEADDINIININIEERDNNKDGNNRYASGKDSRNLQDKKDLKKTEETRQKNQNNPLLRDLIKILILNKLLGGFRPDKRPPVRPPFPGPRPNMPGMQDRPHMWPRYMQNMQNAAEAEASMGIYDIDNYYKY